LLGCNGGRLPRGADAHPFIIAQADIGVLDRALTLYLRDVGSYPTSEQGLRALLADPGTSGWAGPYLDGNSPLDQGRLPYLYRLRPRGRPEVLWLGLDGKPGGRGDDQDVSNLHLDDPLLPSIADNVSMVAKVVLVLLAPLGAIGYLFLPWMVQRSRRPPGRILP
jgi:type II secretion system protein G